MLEYQDDPLFQFFILIILLINQNLVYSEATNP